MKQVENAQYQAYLEQMEAEDANLKPRFSVSIAAQLAQMHPQTLRQYDRLGLVVPARTRGGGRRYSLRDIQHLAEVQYLSQKDGVNLAGIKKIMELEREVDLLKRENTRLVAQVHAQNRVFAATADGEVTSMGRGQRAERPARDNRGQELIFTRHEQSAVVVWTQA